MVHTQHDHAHREPHHSDHHPPHLHRDTANIHGSVRLASVLLKRPSARTHQHGIEMAHNELGRMLMHTRDPHHDDSPHPPRPSNNPAPVRGNPGPFGLLCFGMTTDMLMFITTGWAEGVFLPTVFCYAAFYGGLGQFVAGILELIKGNTFAGTAFSSYGCFWMGWFLLEYLSYTAAGTSKQLYTLAVTGKTLWCGLWAVLTAGFFVVTLRKNGGLMTIFATLVLTFALLAGGVHNPDCHKAAGYVGFLCGSSAIYTAFAELYHEELGITLPGVSPVRYI